jgi:hypothetical protein
VTDAADAALALVRALNARAAGLWHVEGEALVQDAFAPAPDLPPDVASAFARATLSVPLDRLALGIVRAAVERRVIVSIAAELPPEAGSGYWLRAFGAARSIAVPLDAGRRVLSVAVPDSCPLDEEAVAEVVRSTHPGPPER